VTVDRITVKGDRVYRPAGWWTPTVHALLTYLRGVGFMYAPEPLGVDGDREVLRFVPGDSGPTGWAWTVPDTGVRSMARLLREYHDAVRGFVPPADARWMLPSGPASPTGLVCHGDFGPWNVVWRDPGPAGLLDFDLAGPGEPIEDIAYALEYVAPFRDDRQALRSHGFTAPPDRARRIEIFAGEYGLSTTDGLTDAVVRRQELTITRVRAIASLGLEPQRSWVAAGFLDELAARVRWTRATMP
jgi:hypothetical protein